MGNVGRRLADQFKKELKGKMGTDHPESLDISVEPVKFPLTDESIRRLLPDYYYHRLEKRQS